ncbi:hypothetical protein QBC40DRAFT_81320 [Triangularia verruculosa]|uniref:Uncharacterized protein n=1 Tax=Triangularia verruculosa TaxID=2587418 RepID=A0AAN6XHN5_9PEZI|nr:hypothetical protein QBC40DRAFT_81320 [Triangularia verruculosa]
MKLITIVPFFALAVASTTPSATPTISGSPCEQSFDSIRKTMPTQPPELVSEALDSFESEQSTATGSSLTDVRAQCSWAQNWSRTFVGDTPALKTAVSSWNSARSSWISEVRDDATDFVKACSTAFDNESGSETIGQVLALLATDVDECATAMMVMNGEVNVASLTMGPGASPTEGAGQNDDGSDDGDEVTTTTTSSTSTAGAARETGYAMAAAVGVAVAGVMGSL